MPIRIQRQDRGFQLEAELTVPLPAVEVFPFFADAANLQAITPPFLHFEILTQLPITMRAGVRIDYRIRLHGIPIRWQSEITAWEPPYRFVDEQLRGPYRWWIHEHTFLEQDGRTCVHDRVRYGVPGGAVAHRLVVARDLKRIFAYRESRLRAFLGGEPE